jgi:hypothetical protein
MAKRGRHIDTATVAHALPVNQYFNRHQFSELTGVSPGSTIGRLGQLVKRKLLTRKGAKGLKSWWKMSTSQKVLILEYAKTSRDRRGKPSPGKPSKEKRTHNIVEAEVQAYQQSKEMFLKSIRFI